MGRIRKVSLPNRQTKKLKAEVISGLKEKRGLTNGQMELNLGQASTPKRTIETISFRNTLLNEFLARASNIGVRNIDRRKSLPAPQAKRLAINLAELFTRFDLFDRRRSFTAKKFVFTGKKENSAIKKGEPLFKVDRCLYSIMSAGVSPSGLTKIVRQILTIPPKTFHEADVNRKNIAMKSFKLTHEVLIPQLQRIGAFPRAYYTNESIRYRIEKNIDLIVYLGFQRELSERKQKELLERKGMGKKTREEKIKSHLEKLRNRRDVIEQEVLGTKYSDSQLLELFPYNERPSRPKTKPSPMRLELNKDVPKKGKKPRPVDTTKSLF